MRRTKIIATLGPATDDPTVLARLLAAGTDVVRVNFSHGDWDDHERRIAAVREASAASGQVVAVLGDLQGPKIRINKFRDGSVELVDGQAFCLDPAIPYDGGDINGVSIAYENLYADVAADDIMLLDDGKIILEVVGIAGTRVSCKVVSGGTLSDKKGINRQGGGLSASALTDKDREDIRKAAEIGVDWIAVSFVKTADDIKTARKLLRAAGGRAHVMAKIERSEAMDNLKSIIDASDAIMVARGDLGVEIGYATLAGMQKKIIRMTRDGHKVCVTATQMMESMIHEAMPTRAEVSDVANAVMDGTDCVMLSAETSIGAHPVKAVKAMAEVCVGAEAYHSATARMSRHRMADRFTAVDEAIAMAVMYTANHLDVEAIIALTESGATARWMSRIRSDIPIFAFTRHPATQRRISLYRGVYPVEFDVTSTDQLRVFQDIFRMLLDRNLSQEGDLVIVTKGDLEGVSGGTNGMKILRVTGQ